MVDNAKPPQFMAWHVWKTRNDEWIGKGWSPVDRPLRRCHVYLTPRCSSKEAATEHVLNEARLHRWTPLAVLDEEAPEEHAINAVTEEA